LFEKLVLEFVTNEKSSSLNVNARIYKALYVLGRRSVTGTANIIMAAEWQREKLQNYTTGALAKLYQSNCGKIVENRWVPKIDGVGSNLC